MGPTSRSASIARRPLWKSPVPYLFGGIAIMLTLIAMALVILACSHRKRSSGSPGEGEEKSALPMNTALDAEPKIVVIMAGDDKPTYIATPFTSSTCSLEQV